MAQSPFLQNWTTFLNTYQHATDEAVKLYCIQTNFTQKSQVLNVDSLLILPQNFEKSDKCLQFLYSELISESNSFILKGELLDLLHRVIYASYNSGKLVDSTNTVNTLIDFLINICFNHVTTHENTMYRVKALNILSFYIEYEGDDASSRYIHDTYGCEYLIQESQKLSSGNNIFLAEHYLLFLFRYCSWLCQRFLPIIESETENQQLEQENQLSEFPDNHSSIIKYSHVQLPDWLKEQEIIFKSIDFRQSITFFLESISYFSRFTQSSLIGLFFTFYKEYSFIASTSLTLKEWPTQIIIRSALLRYVIYSDDLSMIGQVLSFLISNNNLIHNNNEFNQSNHSTENNNTKINNLILNENDLMILVSKLIFIVRHGSFHNSHQLTAVSWLSKLIQSNKIHKKSNLNTNYYFNIIKYIWREYSDSTSSSSVFRSNNLYPQHSDSIQLKHAKCLLFFDVLKEYLKIINSCKINNNDIDKAFSSNANEKNQSNNLMQIPNQFLTDEIEKVIFCFSEYKILEQTYYLDRLFDILNRLIDFELFHEFIAKLLTQLLHHDIDIINWVQTSLMKNEKYNVSILNALYKQISEGQLQPYNCQLIIMLPIFRILIQKHVGSVILILQNVFTALQRYTLTKQFQSWFFGNEILELVHTILIENTYINQSKVQLHQLLSFCSQNFESPDIKDRSHLYLQMLHYCSFDQISKLTSSSTDSSIVYESISTSISDSKEQQLIGKLTPHQMDGIFFIKCNKLDNHSNSNDIWWDQFLSQLNDKNLSSTSILDLYYNYLLELERNRSKLVMIHIPFELSFDPKNLTEEEDTAFSLTIQYKILKNEACFSQIPNQEITIINSESPIHLSIDLQAFYPVPTEIELIITFSTESRLFCTSTVKERIIVGVDEICQKRIKITEENALFERLWEKFYQVESPVNGASTLTFSEDEIILIPGKLHILRRGKFLRADHYSLLLLYKPLK